MIKFGAFVEEKSDGDGDVDRPVAPPASRETRPEPKRYWEQTLRAERRRHDEAAKERAQLREAVAHHQKLAADKKQEPRAIKVKAVEAMKARHHAQGELP